MKTNILISLSLFALSSSVWAFGTTVSDPKSYTYYIEQLDQGLEALEKAEQQIELATDTYQKVTSVEQRLSGNIQRAKTQLEKLKALQDFSISDVEKSIKYASKILDEFEDIPEYQKEIGKGIDEVFGTKQQKRNDWVSVEAEKKANKQQLMKQAVVDAEVAQGKMNVQLEAIEELTLATNSSESLKDSTDITNTILLEMLYTQRELVTLMANVSKNIAMAEYDGGDEAAKNLRMSNGRDLTKPEDWKSKNSKNNDTELAECGVMNKECYDQDLYNIFSGK